jgi:streptogramin lyase/cytochrome c5
MLKTTMMLGAALAALLAGGCSREVADTAAAGANTAVATAQNGSAYSGVVEGVVSDAAGKPVAGAFVKLHEPDRRLTIMVISQDEGRYAAKQLPPGHWSVQSVGGDYQSAWSQPLDLADRGTAKFNVALTEKRAPDLPAAWPRRMPEETSSADSLPDGPGKTIMLTNCTGCHSDQMVVANHFDREMWKNTIVDMRDLMRESGKPDITEKEAAVLLDYVAANMPPLPPPDPNSRFPHVLMQGEARNYRVVQYDLVDKGAETHDVAVDPDGVGWANQRIGGKIGRFDPVTLEYSEITPPLTTAKKARPGNLQISSKGVIWLPDPNEHRWLSYDIRNAKWTSWPFVPRGQPNGNSMALTADGMVWSSGPGSVRRLDPATGKWNSWDSPTWLRTHVNPGGYGITVAGDGRVWFAENLIDRMARVDPVTGEVKEFNIPVDGIAYPRRMDTDPHGDVWVGLWQAGKVLKIDQKTAEMTVIDPPKPQSGAYSIDFDATNDLMWITLHKVDEIARYNPRTKEWLELPLPQAETDVRRVEVDQHRPNRVWWSSVANDARIGFVELLAPGG